MIPAFNVVHDLSHFGVRVTYKMLRQKFVWPGIYKFREKRLGIVLYGTIKTVTMDQLKPAYFGKHDLLKHDLLLAPVQN